MRKNALISSLIFATILAGCGIPQTQDDSTKDDRTEEYALNALPIINGKQVTGTDRLNVVTLLMPSNNNRYDSFCTGSLITPNYILTAGHCVQDCKGESMEYTRDNMVVGIGQSEKQIKKIYNVAEIHWHPEFYCEENDIRNDIAVIKLTEPVPIGIAVPTLLIPPSLIPTYDEVKSGKLMATSVGFGLTDPDNSRSSGVKYETSWPVYAYCSRKTGGVHSSECKYFETRKEKRGFMYFMSQTTNICSGDSGGPTFITRNGVDYQVAVHSFGDPSCQEYAGMTIVDDYRDFIEEYVDDLAADTVENCTNGVDDNGDGRIDCNDPYCNYAKACQEDCLNNIDDDGNGDIDCNDIQCTYLDICTETCNNNIDDNRDGLTDCEDPRCADSVYCVPENCLNEVDDNLNGLTDCEDPACIGTVYCLPEDCTNGIDDNMNGLVDCNEASCFVLPVCKPENCYNHVDDNGDGLVDCEDPKCVNEPACKVKEICGNGIDDDHNGLIDCNDPACATDVSCLKKEICGNGIDDDLNGLTDCNDPACVTDFSCLKPVSPENPSPSDQEHGFTIDCTNPEMQALSYCQNQNNGDSSDGCSSAPVAPTRPFSYLLAIFALLGIASIRRRFE